MISRKNRSESLARTLAALLVLGMVLAVGTVRWFSQRGVIEVHAAMPEDGGWQPDGLRVEAGQPLHLRLVSDDVKHGFAIGQSDQPALELEPGQPVETTLVFDQPGKYVFYCTRWCGLNHWRMRGTIEVIGSEAEKPPSLPPPLYVTLGLDIDAEHHAEAIPEQKPSIVRGAALDVRMPPEYLSKAYYQEHSPAQTWQALRRETSLSDLDDQQIWDLVAHLWSLQTNPQDLAQGAQLYAENCAACHGETGGGDGVMAEKLAATSSAPDSQGNINEDEHTLQSPASSMDGHSSVSPSDFTDAEHMLGASPAVLHGKIVRGGMGTGMPYWGPIFTDQQIWDLVAYLWTFQFESEVNP
jgi:cytochrome c oxidase subunit 2